MGMDVKRDPKILRRKKIRNSIIIGILAIGAVAATVAVSRLKPAAPSVARSTVWTGVVKKGDFTREVRGAGTLVPEDIRWIPATTTGRIEEIVLRPGAMVKPGTVILKLSNPDLVQQANDAELGLEGADCGTGQPQGQHADDQPVADQRSRQREVGVERRDEGPQRQR